jgi:hypothetical protein
MNAPLHLMAVIMMMIVITRSEYIAHVMATPVYVIKARKRVLVIVVIMLPRNITAVGDGMGVTGSLGDQAVPVPKKTLQENVFGPSLERKYQHYVSWTYSLSNILLNLLHCLDLFEIHC